VTAAVVALSVAVVLLGVLVAGLLRSHAEILKSLHELGAGLELEKAGGPVPVTVDGIASARTSATRTGPTPTAITGATLDGDAYALNLLGADTLVAFLSTGCSTCQAFWAAFRDETPAVPGGARLVVVTRDLDEESPSALRERTPREVPVVVSSETWDGFEVPGSPYFAYVDRTGRVVGEGSAATWPAVVDLMTQAIADRPGDGRHRDSRDEAVLLAAGIGPDHPSLHGSQQ
jgi:hypothetical protein